MRILALLAVVPLLLAPVRLQDSTPGFFVPPAKSPAPESYSLPAAEPLSAPTVIFVSPTVLDASPTEDPSPTSLNLPPAPSPTVIERVIVIRDADRSSMPSLSSKLCQRGMILVSELALLSYQQKRIQATMNLSVAAIGVAAQAEAGSWPDMLAFNRANNALPWFGVPNKAELRDGVAAARQLCTR